MITNLDDILWTKYECNGYSYFRKHLSIIADNSMLGASMYKLMPGQKAFPYHFHHANEETILIIEGTGSIIVNKTAQTVKKNDYISLPKGKLYGHQIINTSAEPLTYLVISTMVDPDVIEYPESNKIGVAVGAAPGAHATDDSYREYYDRDTQVPYFYNEK